jgi:hypothetical protein
LREPKQRLALERVVPRATRHEGSRRLHVYEARASHELEPPALVIDRPDDAGAHARNGIDDFFASPELVLLRRKRKEVHN